METQAPISPVSEPSRPATPGVWLRELVVAAIELSALASLSYGCFLAWRPAGFIVPGAVILGIGVFADVRKNAGKLREAA